MVARHNEAIAKSIPQVVKDTGLTLVKAGHRVWLVGGCVRDLLLNYEPSDYDLVTDALPDEIVNLFPNSVKTNGSFQLVLVKLSDGSTLDVVTLRGPVKSGDRNIFGKSLDEDVLRRDFTINSMYYDIAKRTVLALPQSFADLDAKILSPVVPGQRMYEVEPRRILRAIRFASSLELSISPAVSKELPASARLIKKKESKNWLREEIIELFRKAAPDDLYPLLFRHGLSEAVFPELAAHFRGKQVDVARWIKGICHYCKEKLSEGEQEAFVSAALMWPLIHNRKVNEIEQLDHYIKEFLEHIGLPKKSYPEVEAIWTDQKLSSHKTNGGRYLHQLSTQLMV